MIPALLVIAGYLCGSVPFGLLMARWRTGVDIREEGSGNIGATNVARVVGKKLGVVVLLLDASKGAAPVLATIHFFPAFAELHAGVGLAAFLGHVFPPWLRFRGGKGVATAFGVLCVLAPIAAAAGFAVYALIFVTLRVSSIGSLLAGATTVVTAFALPRPLPYAILTSALFAMMLFTHRGNIRRILRRTEKSL